MAQRLKYSRSAAARKERAAKKAAAEAAQRGDGDGDGDVAMEDLNVDAPTENLDEEEMSWRQLLLNWNDQNAWPAEQLRGDQ